MADIRDRIIPRFGEGDAHGFVHHHPCGGVGVSLEIPAETKAISEEAVSMLEEAKRLFDYAVVNVEQSVESGEDEGVNVLTFTFKDGSKKEFRIRNGSHGLDGNIAEIEEAIERANKAATKAEAAEKLKEAYVKLVAVGLATTAAGTLEWGTYDPSTMVKWTEQLLSSDNQLQARTNIAAAGKAEFDELYNHISSLEINHDAKVGEYTDLLPSLQAEVEAEGYVPGTVFVKDVLNLLYKLIGTATLNTTDKTLKGAVNELYDLMPEKETDDIDMTNDVFYSI